MSLIETFRLVARVRALNRKVALLEKQLEAERYRNLIREDFFVSAAVMGGRGIVGIPPRVGAAYQPQPLKQPPVYDPYQLRGVDLMEFEAEWKPQAEAAGISEHEAKRQFVLELERRRGNKLIEEPYQTN